MVAVLMLFITTSLTYLQSSFTVDSSQLRWFSCLAILGKNITLVPVEGGTTWIAKETCGSTMPGTATWMGESLHLEQLCLPLICCLDPSPFLFIRPTCQASTVLQDGCGVAKSAQKMT